MAYCITLSLYSVRLWRESQILWTWAVTRVIDELLFNLYRLLKSYYVKVRLFSYTTGLQNFPRHYFFPAFYLKILKLSFVERETWILFGFDDKCLRCYIILGGVVPINGRTIWREFGHVCVFLLAAAGLKRKDGRADVSRTEAQQYPPIPKENKMKRIQTAVCRALWSSPRRKWKPVGGNITRWNIRRSCCYAGLDPFK